MWTYQELLAVDKHVVLGDVDSVPGQSEDQLVKGRRVGSCKQTKTEISPCERGHSCKSTGVTIC